MKLYARRGADPVTVIHGGSRGADKLADMAAKALGFDRDPHYPNWEKFGKQAGVFRNQEMIDMDPDLVLAFWDGQSVSTADTIRRAAIAIATQVIRM